MGRPQYGHHFSGEGLVRGGIFSSLFAAVDKKGLPHLLIIYYKVMKALVCEILFQSKFNLCNALRLLHPTLTVGLRGLSATAPALL